jgi:hypothetical protein
MKPENQLELTTMKNLANCFGRNDVRDFDLHFRINYRAACVADYGHNGRKDYKICKNLRQFCFS